jgi:hypothetical protein
MELVDSSAVEAYLVEASSCLQEEGAYLREQEADSSAPSWLRLIARSYYSKKDLFSEVQLKLEQGDQA